MQVCFCGINSPYRENTGKQPEKIIRELIVLGERRKVKGARIKVKGKKPDAGYWVLGKNF